MEDYRIQEDNSVDLNSLVEESENIDTMAVNEKNICPADPNINFGKALLCSVCFLGMYIALYTA